MIRFKARLQAHRGGSLVDVPRDISDRLGGRARIPVRGTLNGLAFRGSTMPTGDGAHCLGFRKDQRSAAGVEIGDMVTIEIERDEQERTLEVPPDLSTALDAEPGLRTAFEALSYTRRREHAAALSSAKRPETRERRLAALVEELLGRLP